MPRPSETADRLANQAFSGFNEDAEHASAAGFGEGTQNKWRGRDAMYYEFLPSGHIRATRPTDGASTIYPKDSLQWNKVVTDYSSLPESLMGQEWSTSFPYEGGQGQVQESVPDELLAAVDPAAGPPVDDVPLPSMADTMAASGVPDDASSVSKSQHGSVDTNPPMPKPEAPKKPKRAGDEDWPTLAEAKAEKEKKAEASKGNGLIGTLSSALGY